jgi:anaerobic ribonucleoside-triphosphate reductase activating protein
MLRILDITAPDINNGNGIRVTLWVAGCNHHCPECHNQWSWDFNQGKDFIEEQDFILSKLENWLSRDYVDGLTISGGDPLCQDNDGLFELKQIINWVKVNFPTKTIWIYTGYVYEDLNEYQLSVIEDIDVLVDGPYKKELRDTSHTPFRGSTNQRIINIRK